MAADKSPEGVEYKELFCEAMFFPLVTPNDLVGWLRALEPNIRIDLSGVPSRKKPSPPRITVLWSSTQRHFSRLAPSQDDQTNP